MEGIILQKGLNPNLGVCRTMEFKAWEGSKFIGKLWNVEENKAKQEKKRGNEFF